MPKIEIDEAEYLKLKADHEASEKDVADLTQVVLGIMGVLGLADENGKPIPELQEEEPEILGPCMKGIGSVLTDMTATKMPGPIGRKATERLAQKFHFIKLIPPILERRGAIKPE